ncbi:MAG: hypothetical protein AM325_009605 [Candidatus Thorarchaeota archaeon SMTZ1-45]|nr:MAG: hypothetical protein AM325_10985 [Candidatus Thorarchaeota archaeon SMTZ1-45]
MTEIPMPGPEPYQQAPKKSTSSDCCKWGAIICVIFIIGIIIIAIVFVGSFWSFFNWGNGEPSYSERSLGSFNNIDVDLFSTFYYDEFDVYSSETQTTTPPDVYFDISVDDTGVDVVTVTIHFAIYEIDQTTFDSIPTWAGLDSYLVEQGDYYDTATGFFNLQNYASTYVWVIWFEASSKTSVWTVDVDLTLRYNWNL